MYFFVRFGRMYFSSLRGRKPEAIQFLPILSGRKFRYSNWTKLDFYWTINSLKLTPHPTPLPKERALEPSPLKVPFGDLILKMRINAPYITFYCWVSPNLPTFYIFSFCRVETRPINYKLHLFNKYIFWQISRFFHFLSGYF